MARITSYINNLHPQRHADLYQIIEQVIGCAIPLWNITLAPLAVPGSRPPWFKRIHYRGSYEEEIVQPEPGLFSPPTPHPPLDLRLKYIDSGLQIIVKLANIELTPTKPRFEGGSWHVEGQLVRLLSPVSYGVTPFLYRMNTFARPRYTIMPTKISPPASSPFDNNQTP